MSARLVDNLENADAAVRAIDGVEGFEVVEVTVIEGRAISVHLAAGADRVPSLARVFGEVWAVHDFPNFSTWDFQWRGIRVTVFGDARPASLAGAA